MYVFGIDLPIMEILFVFALFFTIALVVIWLEIRKLRYLLMVEESDIYTFEKDINQLEKDEKKRK